jgi:hypothetical protein
MNDSQVITESTVQKPLFSKLDLAIAIMVLLFALFGVWYYLRPHECYSYNNQSICKLPQTKDSWVYCKYDGWTFPQCTNQTAPSYSDTYNAVKYNNSKFQTKV